MACLRRRGGSAFHLLVRVFQEKKVLGFTLLSFVPSLRPKGFLLLNERAPKHLKLICVNEVNPLLLNDRNDSVTAAICDFGSIREIYQSNVTLLSNLIWEQIWLLSAQNKHGGTIRSVCQWPSGVYTLHRVTQHIYFRPFCIIFFFILKHTFKAEATTHIN